MIGAQGRITVFSKGDDKLSRLFIFFFLFKMNLAKRKYTGGSRGGDKSTFSNARFLKIFLKLLCQLNEIHDKL